MGVVQFTDEDGVTRWADSDSKAYAKRRQDPPASIPVVVTPKAADVKADEPKASVKK